MNIKETALKVWDSNMIECPPENLTKFAEAIVAEAIVAELAKEYEWQLISTAPKDNTVFLAWRKHATHPLMVRYEPSYDWFANYDGEHVYDLTHWMPLPKPPAIDAAMTQGEKGC